MIWCKRVIILVVVLAATLSTQLLMAQESSSRRVKTKVPPQYPELARRMNVSGKVRLTVKVSPDGQVMDSEVLGGHPVLANAAKDAVKKWKYEPSAQESQITVEFDFNSLGG